MESLHIIKIGGNVIDDPILLDKFLRDFAAISSPKLLVHGGGKMATALASTLGIQQTMIDGRRVTDKNTLNVVVMVYAGLINKTIVAGLQQLSCNAIGLSGADANILKSRKRDHPEIDFGQVGDVSADSVNSGQLTSLLKAGLVPVICPVTHNGEGSLLNTNADSVARVIALAMKENYDVKLTYCFEKKGVLQNTEDENSLIPLLSRQQYTTLKESGIISKGMIPKLDNAFEAVSQGIKQLVICHANSVCQLEREFAGTQLTLA